MWSHLTRQLVDSPKDTRASLRSKRKAQWCAMCCRELGAMACSRTGRLISSKDLQENRKTQKTPVFIQTNHCSLSLQLARKPLRTQAPSCSVSWINHKIAVDSMLVVFHGYIQRIFQSCSHEIPRFPMFSLLFRMFWSLCFQRKVVLIGRHLDKDELQERMNRCALLPDTVWGKKRKKSENCRKMRWNDEELWNMMKFENVVWGRWNDTTLRILFWSRVQTR